MGTVKVAMGVISGVLCHQLYIRDFGRCCFFVFPALRLCSRKVISFAKNKVS